MDIRPSPDIRFLGQMPAADSFLTQHRTVLDNFSLSLSLSLSQFMRMLSMSY